MGKGCKILLIVGIVLAAIIGVGIILSYTYCDEMQNAIATRTVDQIEKDVLANLPDDVNVDEIKSTLTELKDKVKTLIADKKLDFSKMAPIVTQFTEAMSDKKLTSEEVTKLIERIRDYIKN